MRAHSVRYLQVVLLTCFVGVMVEPGKPLMAELESRQVGETSVYGYHDTPLLPWTDGRYHVHDQDRPFPTVVAPGPIEAEGQDAAPPSDATFLFGGDGLEQWQPSSWKVAGNAVVAGEGGLETREAFGDFQLHLEWMTPNEPSANKMNRGNSGVLIMGRYEIQIFDSWPEHAAQIYPDGQAAAIYGQTPPMVNVCRAPGAWQSFDIFFTAPQFQAGKLQQRAFLTMLHNGVVVHLNQPIMGPAAHRDIHPYQAHPRKLPLVLQGHHCPVQFRNIWIRPLD